MPPGRSALNAVRKAAVLSWHRLKTPFDTTASADPWGLVGKAQGEAGDMESKEVDSRLCGRVENRRRVCLSDQMPPPGGEA